MHGWVALYQTLLEQLFKKLKIKNIFADGINRCDYPSKESLMFTINVSFLNNLASYSEK